MTNQDKKKIENSIILYLFIILISMNFLGHGSIFCVVFFMWYIINYNIPTKFDNNFYILMLLFLSVMIASMVHYTIQEVVKSVNYLLLYIIGLHAYRNANDKSMFLSRVLFSLFIGFGLFVVITYFYNLSLGFVTESRIIINFWTNKAISVTLVGLISSVVIGYSFYGLFIQKRMAVKIFTLFVLVVTMLLNFITATRTPLLLLIVVWSCMALLNIVSLDKIKKVRFLASILIFVIVIAFAFVVDLFGVKTYITSLPIWNRFEESGFETSRWEISRQHFKLMFDYPFGGENISTITGGHAHNFIQECYDLYGIFAFVFMVIITISFLKNIINLLKKKNKSDLDYLLIIIYVCVIIQMMLEPVLTGYPILLWIFLFVHGVVSQYLIGDHFHEVG